MFTHNTIKELMGLVITLEHQSSEVSQLVASSLFPNTSNTNGNGNIYFNENVNEL